MIKLVEFVAPWFTGPFSLPSAKTHTLNVQHVKSNKCVYFIEKKEKKASQIL